MGCPILLGRYVATILSILIIMSLSLGIVGLAEDEDDVQKCATWFLAVGGRRSEVSGYSIVLDERGDIYLAGHTSSWGNSTKALLLKTDRLGRVLFTIIFGGTKDDEAHDITINGTDAYIVGATQSFGSGGKDSFIAKINMSGEIEWFLVLGGALADVLRAIDYSGEMLYVTGYTKSFGEGSSDVLVAKITSKGKLEWVTTFGGEEAEKAYDLHVDKYGNIYVVGRTESYGFGSSDAFIAKLDSSGEIDWFKVIGTKEEEEATSITIDSYGNIYVTGRIKNATTDDNDVFVAKLNSTNGSIDWIKVFRGREDDIPNSITCSRDTVYVVGETMSFLTTQGDHKDMFVLALNSDTGEARWLLLIGGRESDVASAIYVDEINVYLAGSSESFSSGRTDLAMLRLENTFIESLNSTTELIWVGKGFQNNVLIKKISNIRLSDISQVVSNATYVPKKISPTVNTDYPKNVSVKPVIPHTYIATPTGGYPVEVETVIQTKTIVTTSTVTVTSQVSVKTITQTITNTVTSTKTVVETSYALDLTTLLGVSTIVLCGGIIAGYMLGKDLLYTHVLSKLKKSKQI